MDLYKIICPYCDFPNISGEYVEGYQAAVCRQCGQPFLNLTKMVPSFTSLRVVGFVDVLQRFPTLDDIEEDAKYYAKHPEELDAIECNDCIECNEAEHNGPACEQKQDICTQNTGENEQNGQNVNRPREGHYWPSDKDVLICAHCGKGYEDHGITNGVCPACFLDEDSVKGIKINEPRSEFKPLITNTKVLYRCDPEYVDIKYCQNAHVRTSWADIYSIIEEVEEDRRPIIASLLGAEGNKPKVTGVNVFVHAVEQGCVPEAPSIESEV